MRTIAPQSGVGGADAQPKKAEAGRGENRISGGWSGRIRAAMIRNHIRPNVGVDDPFRAGNLREKLMNVFGARGIPLGHVTRR